MAQARVGINTMLCARDRIKSEPEAKTAAWNL